MTEPQPLVLSARKFAEVHEAVGCGFASSSFPVLQMFWQMWVEKGWIVKEEA